MTIGNNWTRLKRCMASSCIYANIDPLHIVCVELELGSTTCLIPVCMTMWQKFDVDRAVIEYQWRSGDVDRRVTERDVVMLSQPQPQRMR